eukprot:gene15996-biopygen18756
MWADLPISALHVADHDMGRSALNTGRYGGDVPPPLYINPKTGRRGASNVRKSGKDAWVAWNKQWYTQFDLSFTGFLINGDRRRIAADACRTRAARHARIPGGGGGGGGGGG